MIEKIEKVTGAFGWTKFKIGDLVTRGGADVHRVVEVQDDGQCITVECVKEPLGYLEEDGITRSEPWCRVGDREFNMARRYQYASEVIDAEEADIVAEDLQEFARFITSLNESNLEFISNVLANTMIEYKDYTVGEFMSRIIVDVRKLRNVAEGMGVN